MNDDSMDPPTLGGLVAQLNCVFGQRLLASCEPGEDGTVTFDEFVRVAEGVVGEDPRQAAVHLAGLIALDVARLR